MKSRAFSLLVVTMILSSAIVLCFGGIISAQEEPDTIYIDDGSYYIAGPYDAWSYGEIWVNVTVTSGGNVDVYVMSYTQVDNAYNYDPYYYGGYQPSGDNITDPRAVSFKPASEEDTSSARIHYVFDTSEESYYTGPEEGIFIIIDNRECDITPDDADPSGVVVLDMTMEYTEGGYFDDFDLFIWPVIGIIVLEALAVVGVIILLFLVVRHFDKKKKAEQALQPQPAYPYYAGQPYQPQYQQPMYPQQVQPVQPPQPPQPVQPIEPIVQPPSEAPAQPPTESPPRKPKVE